MECHFHVYVTKDCDLYLARTLTPEDELEVSKTRRIILEVCELDLAAETGP